MLSRFALFDEKEFVQYTRLAVNIFNSGADWETIFNTLFSARVLGKIRELNISFEWNDPDLNYEADCTAFITALCEKTAQLKLILDAAGVQYI